MKVITTLTIAVAVLLAALVSCFASLKQANKRARYHLNCQTALEEVINNVVDDNYFMDVIVESDAWDDYLQARGY